MTDFKIFLQNMRKFSLINYNFLRKLVYHFEDFKTKNV
jgi:hypothetical protein